MEHNQKYPIQPNIDQHHKMKENGKRTPSVSTYMQNNKERQKTYNENLHLLAQTTKENEEK